MPDSTTAAELPAPRPLRRRVVENLGLATVLFALLECWRPLYFLTDDNLDEGFPLWTGMGRRLVQGQSPAVAEYLFGGHYSLLRDSSNFCFCWHPFYLLAALLTQTPARLFATEFAALAFIWLAVSGFVLLAHQLRRELNLPLGDWRLMLIAQSFTFSMIALCTGSSRVDFLANHSALPWLALGILQTDWRRGLALTALFFAHQILGGHLGMVISCSLLLTLFALGIAGLRRSYVPLITWFGGGALALLVLAPLLLPATEGFFASHRSQGLSEAFMDRFSFPALLLPLSYFFGVFSTYAGFDYRFGYCAPWYSASFASCAAAWLIVPALLSRARWSGLEILCAAMVVLAAFLAIRPAWLGEIMTHVPLLRSMRWPFREILEMQFFLHLSWSCVRRAGRGCSSA
jgi:hypothetical protein